MDGRGSSILTALALAGCLSAGEGVDLPLDRIYYPVGMAADKDKGAEYLFVVNSDFDLQYNGGSVQALSLDRIRGLVPRGCSTDSDCASGRICDNTSRNGSDPSYWCVEAQGNRVRPCGELGERPLEERLQRPGLCQHVDLRDRPGGGPELLIDAVEIKAFASDALYASNPNGQGVEGRLFIPVRGDSTLHWIDVGTEGRLECGQGAGTTCGAQFRVGEGAAQVGGDDLVMPAEPTGIAASRDGTALVVTHEFVSQLSLFVNDWDTGAGPRLTHLSEPLSGSPVGIAAVDGPPGAFDGDRFLVGFRGRAELALFQAFDDEAAAPKAPFLEPVGSAAILANYSGADSRGIVVDAAEREECERRCDDDGEACGASCEGVPVPVYVANRAPSSLLVGHIEGRGTPGPVVTIADSVPTPFGPSRVAIGDIVDTDGEFAKRVFVVSFDSRRIGIYDPDLRQFERWVITGRGPQALILDSGVSPEGENYALAYVGHFTDSYIGVVQLDQRQRHSFGEIVLSVGEPVAPRGSN